MANHTIAGRLRYFRYNTAKAGAKPGTLFIPHDAQPTRVFEYHFKESELLEFSPCTLHEARNRPAPGPEFTRWIDIRGLQDPEMFAWLADEFGLHPLEIEDLTSYQQPKCDEHFGHFTAVVRMLYLQKNLVVNDQLSVFVIGQTVLTVQETYDDVLEPVRNRLRNETMPIRKRQSEYLAYALLDAVIDHYFIVLNQLGERMEKLETALINKPRRNQRNEIMQLKHDLLQLRRIIWPTRELANNLLRNDFLCGQDDIRLYLRDLYDHLVNLMDLTENYREISSNMLDLYNTAVSNNMNEIMKVLTMISAIFIPLSFIAGVYGMNFAPESLTGESLPLNMPELYKPQGYVWVLAGMGLIALLQLLLFWRKGWFRKW
jgi:magnesium transporter